MISGPFPRSFRLLKGSQFQAISNKSNTFYGKALYITWKENTLSHARLGITVTKKFGDAHLRNRFKRLTREGFRLQRARMELGLDIHVRPKKREKSDALPSFADITDDLKEFFTSYYKRR